MIYYIVEPASASLRPYALQFWLRLPALRAKRMYDRYQKIKQKHFQLDDSQESENDHRS